MVRFERKLRIADLCLAHGADVNARERESQNTPLMHAVQYGAQETWMYLLEKKADVFQGNDLFNCIQQGTV